MGKRMKSSFQKYVDGISKGKIICCRFVKLVVKRHLNDLKKAKKKDYPYKFDKKKAEHVIKDMEGLTLWEGESAGQPLILMPHHAFIVGCLIGWVDKKTGKRRFTEAYCEMARKGAKSVIAAALLAWEFRRGNEPGGLFQTAATKKDQSGIVYRHAERMLAGSVWEREDRQIQTLQYKMKRRATYGEMVYLAINRDTMDGPNPYWVVLDELHQHKYSDVYDAVTTGMGQRRDPLLFCISTAGTNHHGIGKQQHDYTISVLKGMVEDERFFGIIYTIDRKVDWPDLLTKEEYGKQSVPGVVQEDDYFDENVWIKANPGIDYDVPRRDYIRQRLNKTRGLPTLLNEILTKHFNLWMSAAAAWIDVPTVWDTSKPVLGNVRRNKAFIGIDLSGSLDLTACVWLIPQPKGICEILLQAWTCDSWLDMPDNPFVAQIRQWEKDGFIKIHSGPTIKSDLVIDDIIEFKKQNGIYVQSAAVERGFEGRTFPNKLNKALGGGTKKPKVGAVGMQQLTPVINEIEGLLKEGRILHYENPVLRFSISNTSMKISEDERRKHPVKGFTQHHKIDPTVALFMAYDRYSKFVQGPYSGEKM
jgi:phage terminase large subunit-like protein